VLVKVHLPCGRKRCLRMAVAREPRSHHSMTTTMRTSVGASSRTSRTSSGHPRPAQHGTGTVQAGKRVSKQNLHDCGAPVQATGLLHLMTCICALTSQ